jgi:hypothetical protein
MSDEALDPEDIEPIPPLAEVVAPTKELEEHVISVHAFTGISAP